MIEEIIVVEVQLVRATGQMDYVFPVQNILRHNRVVPGRHGLLRPQAILVAAMALWRFLDGWHGAPAFIGLPAPPAVSAAGAVRC